MSAAEPRIWKYSLDNFDRSGSQQWALELPANAQILHIDHQSYCWALWALIPNITVAGERTEKRVILCQGTGIPFPEGITTDLLKHLGTQQDGVFVWHFFEVLTPPYEPSIEVVKALALALAPVGVPQVLDIEGCRNALREALGDFDKAVNILAGKGKVICPQPLAEVIAMPRAPALPAPRLLDTSGNPIQPVKGSMGSLRVTGTSKDSHFLTRRYPAGFKRAEPRDTRIFRILYGPDGRAYFEVVNPNINSQWEASSWELNQDAIWTPYEEVSRACNAA